MEQVKQTAVEWLADKIKWNWQDIEYGEISMSNLVEQAKAMEKEQIIDAWDNGFANGYDLGKYDDDCNPDDAEQYYKETYGK